MMAKKGAFDCASSELEPGRKAGGSNHFGRCIFSAKLADPDPFRDSKNQRWIHLAFEVPT
jgi:hypothetical protein